MTNKEKYPDLWAKFEELQEARKKIAAVVDPLRAKRDSVVAKMQPLEEEAKKLADEIKKHAPALGALDNQISRLARAMGGKSV